MTPQTFQKLQKDLFEMHASMRGTSQHHNSTHGNEVPE